MRKMERGSCSCTAGRGGISVFMESVSLTSLVLASAWIQIVAFLFPEENNAA